MIIFNSPSFDELFFYAYNHDMSQFVAATLIFWICVHFGFSMTQVADHFLFGRNQESVVPNYQENFIQSSKIRNEIDLTTGDSKNKFMSDDFATDSNSIVKTATSFVCQFTFFGSILDFISKIYILDYEFFTSYEEEVKDSIINWIFQAFRLLSLLFGIVFTVQIITLLFSSGILTALMGRAGLVGGGLLLGGGVLSTLLQGVVC